MDNLEPKIYAFLIYIAFVSLVASVLTILDKYFAVAKKRRVPEKVLFFFAYLGGALAEYAVMKMIHHKTLHKSFMIGLPVIFSVHFLLIIAVELYIHGVFG